MQGGMLAETFGDHRSQFWFSLTPVEPYHEAARLPPARGDAQHGLDEIGIASGCSDSERLHREGHGAGYFVDELAQAVESQWIGFHLSRQRVQTARPGQGVDGKWRDGTVIRQPSRC